MPPSNQRMIFLRRISALLIFFVVLFAFAMLFYFKYIPANKEELNQRGHRVLNQLIRNFQNKDNEFQGIIDNADQEDPSDLIAQTGSYARLNDNIPYDVIPQSSFSGKTFSSLYRQGDGAWSLLYRMDTAKTNPNPYLSVSVQDFADPLLSARKDIFQTYFILLDSANQKDPKKHNYYILCKNNPVSAAEDINADTLQLLEKNSDKSGICNITIAGDTYVLFFAPFSFHNSRLLMAGLIPTQTYTEKVQSTPLYLLSSTIILISLILSALPLFKLFLLSPNESISSVDVLRTAISFYIGSIIVAIIAFYGFLVYVTDMSLHHRLKQFSGEIRKDIETEIDLADRQISYYDSAIGILDNNDAVKLRLAKEDFAKNGQTDSQIDSLCTPRIFPNTSRLMWGYADGATLAKWSPFDYATPFTDLSGYRFFELLDERPAYLKGPPGPRYPVVYTGKSNLTDEFLTSIARPSTTTFGSDQSSFIVLAATLHSAVLPVVPKGFGFALIDNTGKVLIDADPKRNLSENLFEESGEDPLLSGVVRDQRTDIDFGIELYGEPYTARVAPIAGQPLTLVCYYDERTLTDNIFRYLHFGVHSLALLLIMLMACLLLSTFKEWTPTLLNFKINKAEWIRPSSINADKRPFVFVYFLYMLVLTILFFSLIAGLSTNLDNIFYISMLLPFYVMIGVQTSEFRSADNSIILLREYAMAAIYPLAGVLILNIAIFRLMGASGQDRANFLVPAAFQICILLVKPFIFWNRLGPWLKGRQTDLFRGSVYLSILLISVLPTLGILTYGFYAEKIQFKKDKLFRLSNDFFERSNYLLNDFFPTIRPVVRQQLGPYYEDSLIYANSIYLTDRDTILRWQPDTLTRSDYLSDGLYSLLMDKIYQAPRIWGDDVCIQDTAGDGSWSYRSVAAPIAGSAAGPAITGPAIAYAVNRPVRDVAAANNHIRLISNLRKPQQDFFSLPLTFKIFFVLAIIALLFLAKKVIHEAIQRLFLLDIVKSNKIVIEDAYIRDFFKPENMPATTTYVKNLTLPTPFSIEFFDRERDFLLWQGRPAQFTQEEFILAMADHFQSIYESIWYDLSDPEKYILLDFSRDRYTNYKNSTILYKLINKGILTEKGDCLDVFSLSFRQYVLSLDNSEDVVRLKTKFKISGAWDSIRIPVMAILAVVAVFLFMTQAAFSSGIIAAITALSTIVPMLVRLFSKSGAAG